MRGKIIIWNVNSAAPLQSYGFICPDGCDGKRKTDLFYCNARSVRYHPVHVGHRVEFEVAEKKYENVATLAAFKVERVFGERPLPLDDDDEIARAWREHRGET
jgi:hypothetical protein